MNQTHSLETRQTTRNCVLYTLVAALLLGCGGYLLFYHLDIRPIALHDEAWHGINAYEMDQNNEWIISTYLGEIDYFNLKPPLSMWCIIAGYRLFGYNAFGLRFYSAFAMLLTMTIVTIWLKKRYGSIASLFALALLVGQELVYAGHSARYGDADALFILFYTIAMLYMLDSEHDIRRLYGTAICFGLGFMTKSWHAAMIPFTCLVYLCASGQIRKLKPHHYILLIICGLLPIAPWAILRIQRDGLAFFIQSFETDIQKRMAANNSADPIYHFRTLFNYSGTIIGLCLCAIGTGLCLAKKRRLVSAGWGLALWILLPPLLYNFSQFKVYWYIFPILPGLAAAGGIVMDRVCRYTRRKILCKIFCWIMALGLMIQIGFQFDYVNNLSHTNSFQRTILEKVDRDVDGGIHVYVKYENGLSNWVDSDRLCVMLAGDGICLDGGEAAFVEDEENALLFVNKFHFSYDLLEYYPVVLEYGDNWVLMN